MGQMTMCYIKEVTSSDEHPVIYHPTTVLLSSPRLFNFSQLIVLVLQPTALLFWFPFTTLIKCVSRWQLFSTKNALINPLCTTCQALNNGLTNIVEHLATKESHISLRSYMCGVVRNLTPN